MKNCFWILLDPVHGNIVSLFNMSQKEPKELQNQQKTCFVSKYNQFYHPVKQNLKFALHQLVVPIFNESITTSAHHSVFSFQQFNSTYLGVYSQTTLIYTHTGLPRLFPFLSLCV